MVRQFHRLSPAGLTHAKPGMHPDDGGLYLQVTETRHKGLGSLQTIGLGEARERAKRARELSSTAKSRSPNATPRRRPRRSPARRRRHSNGAEKNVRPNSTPSNPF
jgi:hypothetical protein